MLKNSIFVMSVFAIGLSLGSNVEAAKIVTDEVEYGPMDRFVTRTTAPRPVTIVKKPRRAIRRSSKSPHFYVGSDLANMPLGGLNNFQKAYILKNS